MSGEGAQLKECRVNIILARLSSLRESVQALAQIISEHGVGIAPSAGVPPRTASAPEHSTLWLLNSLPDIIDEIKSDINTQIGRLKELF